MPASTDAPHAVPHQGRVRTKHQLNMCYKQTGHLGEKATNFLYDGDIVGKGEVVLTEKYPSVYERFCELTHACFNTRTSVQARMFSGGCIRRVHSILCCTQSL